MSIQNLQLRKNGKVMTFIQITFFGLFWFIRKRLYKSACLITLGFLAAKFCIFILFFFSSASANFSGLSISPVEVIYFALCALVVKPQMLFLEASTWLGFNALIGLNFIQKKHVQIDSALNHIDPDNITTLIDFIILIISQFVLFVLCMDVSEYLKKLTHDDLVNYIYFEFTIISIMVVLFFSLLLYKINKTRQAVKKHI
jgi:hypothetical protein